MRAELQIRPFPTVPVWKSGMSSISKSWPRVSRALPQCARFEVHADHNAQTLARLASLFAAMEIIPIDLHARRSAGGMWIGVEVEIDIAHAGPIADSIRAMVGVLAVIDFMQSPTARYSGPVLKEDLARQSASKVDPDCSGPGTHA